MEFVSLLSTIKMAGSIKLFQFILKYYHMIGIHSPISNSNNHSLDSKNWIFIMSYVLFTLSSGAFFFCEAKNLLDYGMSFFATIGGISLMMIHLVVAWQMENTLLFIGNCEGFIEKSKVLIQFMIGHQISRHTIALVHFLYRTINSRIS